MKTAVLLVVAAGCLLALATWLARGPASERTNGVPAANGAQQPAPAPVETVSAPQKAVVQKGLDYLARQQFEDGHWEGDGGNHPVAMTGMAGLALLMERTDAGASPSQDLREMEIEGTAQKSKYAPNIRKAADWLMAHSQAGRDGLTFSEHASETSRYMQGHGLATIFLAGVCANETNDARRKKLTDVLARAVTYIVKAQSTQGGWHDTSRVEGHDFAKVSATAIQVQALQAVETAGIPVPQEVLNSGLAYLKAATEKSTEPADAAAAVACLSRPRFVGLESWEHSKWREESRSRFPKARDLRIGIDEQAHYYRAQAEHDFGDDGWNAYRATLFDRLREAQNKDGSWPAGNGICAGKVFSTAVWCTVLQLGNNSHPSRQTIVGAID